MLNGHSDKVKSVALSRDGKTVISEKDDTTIRIWNAETIEQIRVLNGHSD